MKKEIIDVLRKEILWCRNNPLISLTKKQKRVCTDMDIPITESFENGFIAGLEQAIRLVRKIPKL